MFGQREKQRTILHVPKSTEAYKHGYGDAAGGLTEASDRPKLVD